ncbi:MAG TPA: cupredoxin domain-containing protein [Dehalococcoidia bacterium]|nr:cupredoxin domain-containing protein [Dehalococcoidia bacterium]
MPKAGINMKLGLVLFIVAFGIAAPSLYGLSQLVKVDEVAATGGPAVATGGPTTVDISAQSLQFDKHSMTVSAGQPVTINFNNKDAGVSHNIAVYTNKSASSKIFGGDLDAGPKTLTYNFTAPSTPGTYYFRCDVHPDTMNGEFIVQ